MSEQPRRAIATGALVDLLASERDRIARTLHDEVVQSVSVAALHVELLAAAPTSTAEDLEVARSALAGAVRELRAVMGALRRPQLGPGGLAELLRVRLGGEAGDEPVAVIDDFVREPEEPLAAVLCWTVEEIVRALRVSAGYRSVSITLRSPLRAFEVEVIADAPASGPLVVLDEARRLVAIAGGAIRLDESRTGTARMLISVPAAS